MKKIIYSLMILLAVSFSCEDFLEEESTELSPDNFPTSEGDILALFGPSLNHLHNSGGYFERSLMFMAEVGADNAGTRRNVGDDRGDMNFYTFDANNAEVARTWRELYQGINEMNFIIQALEQSEESWAPPYLGASKAWRAYLYSDLVQLFGDVPLLTKPVESIAESQDAIRTPTLEVYDQVIKDLQEAETLLAGFVWDIDGLPGEAFAKLALARVYMTMAGAPVNDASMWSLAAAKAKEVKALGRHSLIRPYADLWLLANKNNEEIILAGQRTLNGPNTRSLLNSRTRPRDRSNIEGTGDFNSNIEFYNKFSSNDIRRDVSVALFTVDPTVDPADTTFYQDIRGGNELEAHPHYRKYWDSDRPPEEWRDQARRNSNAVPVFRYAEALLILAETENEANGPTEDAYDAINEVRDRAGLPPLGGLSQEQFRDSVRLERELELCMEGKRRFDLIRWGTFLEVMAQDQFAGENIRPFHVLFPIPLNELRLNPGIQQNEGYTSE